MEEWEDNETLSYHEQVDKIFQGEEVEMNEVSAISFIVATLIVEHSFSNLLHDQLQSQQILVDLSKKISADDMRQKADRFFDSSELGDIFKIHLNPILEGREVRNTLDISKFYGSLIHYHSVIADSSGSNTKLKFQLVKINSLASVYKDRVLDVMDFIEEQYSKKEVPEAEEIQLETQLPSQPTKEESPQIPKAEKIQNTVQLPSRPTNQIKNTPSKPEFHGNFAQVAFQKFYGGRLDLITPQEAMYLIKLIDPTQHGKPDVQNLKKIINQNNNL